MSTQLEVPRLEDLIGLGIAVEPSDELGVVSLIAWANDRSTVTLTWDEVAASANVRWHDPDGVRLALERETAMKITVREEPAGIEFRV